MRYVCVHGHFYQPPRENPSLEAVEMQDSAYPYHDWNERITAECYAPNATSRILERRRIFAIVNNYAHISFNFGPTLLSWIRRRPGALSAILESDRSRRNFRGHGSAIAQAYNHMILPLANRRTRYPGDMGIHDFQHRFGRVPEGMWLPETAVDWKHWRYWLSMDEVHDVRTAPGQTSPQEWGRWKDVSGARIDPSRAYQERLPSQGSTCFSMTVPSRRAWRLRGCSIMASVLQIGDERVF